MKRRGRIFHFNLKVVNLKKDSVLLPKSFCSVKVRTFYAVLFILHTVLIIQDDCIILLREKFTSQVQITMVKAHMPLKRWSVKCNGKPSRPIPSRSFLLCLCALNLWSFKMKTLFNTLVMRLTIWAELVRIKSELAKLICQSTSSGHNGDIHMIVCHVVLVADKSIEFGRLVNFKLSRTIKEGNCERNQVENHKRQGHKSHKSA